MINMQQFTLDKSNDLGNVTEYVCNWEHLMDELKRLDLMLNLYILSHDVIQPDNPMDQLMGLVISREEVAGLFEEANISNPDQIKVKELSKEFEILSETIEKRRAESLKKNIPLTLNALSEIFGLSRMEEQCIIICLAIELDTKYEKLYGYIQNDITKKKPTVDMVLKLLCVSFEDRLSKRAMFRLESALFKFLMDIDENTCNDVPLISQSLKLQNRIVEFILENKNIDDKLVDFSSCTSLAEDAGNNGYKAIVSQLSENKLDIIKKVEKYYSHIRLDGRNTVFNFYGASGSGKKLLVESVCKTIKMPLLTADYGKIDTSKLAYEEDLLRLIREALLQGAVLCIENTESLFYEENKRNIKLKHLIETVNRFLPVTFLLSEEKLGCESAADETDYLNVEVESPDEPMRRELWDSFIKESGVKCSGIDGIAGKFAFTPGQIRSALRDAQRGAAFNGSPKKISKEGLYRSCRIKSGSILGKLSQKIEPKQSLNDIVLPDDQMEQLEEIVEYVKQKEIVYGNWGFGNKLSRGKGLNILFSGPPGTGKTMAAEVIAKELLLDLYKIDLSQVVSKYIGETEKNLSRIFKEARTSNAILFFDEADAIFGKRSEVKDAHDRYANVETAYLLQKMEEYEGITILATNLRGNMDEAFTRRMVFSIDFPFPEEEYRVRLWKSVFPKEAPIGKDVDFVFLSSRFKIPGGNIRNIALKAAFYAARDGSTIKMLHMMKAIKREYQKMGRICVKSDFGDYYDMVK